MWSEIILDIDMVEILESKFIVLHTISKVD